LKKSLRISLKGGERIFVNGAVLRVDRKVSFEFLNEVSFLLEAHVMHSEQTTTPLRQIYYFVQTMLIDPAGAETACDLYRKAMLELALTITSKELLNGLERVAVSVESARYYDAMRLLRGLFPLEQGILDNCRMIETAMTS
jgi:flagellar biosynthesis repressor protein FlbT